MCPLNLSQLTDMPNHKSSFTLSIEALKLWEKTVVTYDEDFVKTNKLYPRISRLSRRLRRMFECRRLSPNSFEVKRTY